MQKKTKEKDLAIRLRKRGYSYNEILRRVPVAKSTLSLWLRSVNLAKKQKQRLTEKRKQARLRGVEAIRKRRKEITKKLLKEGIQEIGELRKRDLFILGIGLYWCEGSKQKEGNISEPVIFSNSDSRMVKVFLEWLEVFCNIRREDCFFSIYIHESINKKKIEKIEDRWRSILTISKEKNIKIRLKKNKIKRKRKNNANYLGVMRVTVRKSTNLNRKISGWIEGVIRN